MGFFAYVQARVSLLVIAGLVALVAIVALTRGRPPTLRPAVFVAVPTAHPAPAPAPEPPIDERSRVQLLDSYDARALALMNGEQDLSDRELQARLLVGDIDADVEVYRLRENERLIQWDSPPPKIHGGGARASVFVYDGKTWRQAGHVDSALWTSFVWSISIDADQGIAIMVEDFDGNGAPPARAVAFAVDGSDLVSTSVEDVPRIDVDSTGPEPIIRLWRRVHEVNPYPGRPIRGSRWKVRRTRHGLVATETPNTPWIDALDTFCSDPAHSDASPAIRARVARCTGEADVRWAAGKRLVVTLGLILQCGEDQQHHGEAELRLEAKNGDWRVVEASSCFAKLERL